MPDSAAETEFAGLYASPCGYFDGQTSHYTIYRMATPQEAKQMAVGEKFGNAETYTPETCQQILFDSLLEKGFRRTDDLVYRADCPDCRKCTPIRITAKKFEPSKSQRRILRVNSDISVKIETDPEQFITDEKAMLYSAYDKRHNPDERKPVEAYRDDLYHMNGITGTADGITASYSGTINMDYRIRNSDGTPGRLIGTGIIDAGADSLSSNYFYYDTAPEIMKRSIGTYSILREIELCTRLGFTYYYLGYWIADCRKMVYKKNFRPHELCTDGNWKEV